MKNRQLTDKELNKEKVLSCLRQNRVQLRNFGVKKIGLFGSFVRKEPHLESDLDFLVEFDKEKKTFRNFIGLAHYLEDLFNNRIEIVTTEALSPYIGPHIIEEVEYAAL